MLPRKTPDRPPQWPTTAIVFSQVLAVAVPVTPLVGAARKAPNPGRLAVSVTRRALPLS